MDQTKPDYTLRDGRKISIDLYLISLKEYRSIFAEDTPREEETGIVSKCCVGLNEGEVVDDLPYPDAQALYKAFFNKASETVKENPT